MRSVLPCLFRCLFLPPFFPGLGGGPSGRASRPTGTGCRGCARTRPGGGARGAPPPRPSLPWARATKERPCFVPRGCVDVPCISRVGVRRPPGRTDRRAVAVAAEAAAAPAVRCRSTTDTSVKTHVLYFMIVFHNFGQQSRGNTGAGLGPLKTYKIPEFIIFCSGSGILYENTCK